MSARNDPPSPYESLLASLGVDASPPSAESLGFSEITGKQIEKVLAHLRANPEAPSRIEAFLPRLDVVRFVPFIMLAIHRNVEARFIEAKTERGRKVKASLRKRIRSGERSRENLDMLAAAAAAFDTRRMGLTGCNYSLLLIAREYVRFRAGVELRPREWQAILEAAYGAAETNVMVDGENVTRNLRRLAKKRPLQVPSGFKAVEIIEGRRLVIKHIAIK